MSKTKKLIVTFLFIHLTCYLSYSQSWESSAEIRRLRPTGITANLGSTSILVGGTISRYVSPALEANFSFGVGYFTTSFAAGANYHLTGNNRWSPYIGGNIMIYEDLDIFSDSKETMYSVYTPVGIQYFGPEGFTIGLEVGPMIDLGTSEFLSNTWGGIMIGYRFKN
ncbi:MAG: hypothetical protein ACR2MX_16975 [Cyclobacteriaceae bacterium]